MKNNKTKIRVRIFAIISVMLLFAFALIGVIFNIAARQYIQSSALSQLDKSYNGLLGMVEQAESFTTVFPNDAGDRRFYMRGNAFRIEANMFVVDSECDPLDSLIITDEMLEIITAVKDKGINIQDLHNERLRTANGEYYASGFHTTGAPTESGSAYWLIYADVTGLSQFAVSINFFLVILVCVMFIIAMIVTFFLSISITRPIQKLSAAALRIGRGDFTPNDFKFRDREFEDLNTALNKSAKQLGVYDSEQKAFFQNVSHELRTPLMSIQCYAEGISCGLMEPKGASDTILQETGRLNEMVKDLLYISKIDNITSTYTATKVELGEMLRDCTKRQQAVADKKLVRFSFDFDEAPVYCDCLGELISRATDNLISNAIRYASSEIVLSCRKKADQVAICVADDGAGIDAETLPHIFERFYKGADGNHGIGLSIVKSIVEQHGGSVKAENASKGGAVFTITLPCKWR